jgi:hypothetical protein
MFEVNTTIMRCLVKNLAMFGSNFSFSFSTLSFSFSFSDKTFSSSVKKSLSFSGKSSPE